MWLPEYAAANVLAFQGEANAQPEDERLTMEAPPEDVDGDEADADEDAADSDGLSHPLQIWQSMIITAAFRGGDVFC